jgi:23S rRNA (guanosine2251-2'-O)-methyltransferase
LKSRAPDLLVGVNPVLEQLRREPGAISELIVAHGARGGAARVAGAASRAGVPMSREDSRRLHTLAGGLAHQGVVALLRATGTVIDLPDLLESKPACVVVADQVTDPRNLGALLRSAEGAGAGGVVVPRDRSAALSAVVAKASAGASAFMRIAEVVNLARALEEMKRAGYWIVGLDGGATQSVFEFSFPNFCALVVGAEGRGLRPLTRSTCDHLVSIPMLGKSDSLNVSVAAAVALYERVRQATRR